MKNYRYYEFVMVAFVVVLICSNLIGPAKIAQVDWPVVGTLTFGAGVLFFPISYVFGDILTEVYGYARARRVIWAGFAGLAFASAMATIVVALPPAPFWKNQEAYEIAFGTAWRIAGASMFAYFCGEFVNSYVLARMKILTAGRWLWTRTIGSTIFGEAVDSVLFYPLAFLQVQLYLFHLVLAWLHSHKLLILLLSKYACWHLDKLLLILHHPHCQV